MFNKMEKIQNYFKSLNPKKRITSLIFLLAAVATILTFFVTIFPTKKNVKSQQLTIYVHDLENNPALVSKGILNAQLIKSHRVFNSMIGDGGRVIFEEIGNENLGDSLVVGIEATGWEIIGNTKYVYSGKPILIKVREENSLGIIKGVIKTRNGEDLIPNVLININSDTSIVSKADGSFNVLLPRKYWVEKVSVPYKLTLKSDGYKVKSEYCYPNQETEIRLSTK